MASLSPSGHEQSPSLLSLVGLEVIDSGDMGRIATAHQDYVDGDVLLEESPTIVFDPEAGYAGMMDAYLGATETEKLEIMDMYCPPMPTSENNDDGNEDNDNGPTTSSATEQRRYKEQQTRQRLQILEHEWQLYMEQKPAANLPLNTAKRLMRIIDASAHNYHYSKPMEEESTTSTGGSDDKTGSNLHGHISKDYIALFTLGSRVEHSCAPNLSYAITKNGKLQYTAARPISKGTRVSISYETAGFVLPRYQRRDFLQMNKDFMCGCSRCRGPDECCPYVVSCPVCPNLRAVAFSSSSRYNTTNPDKVDDEFRCISCKSIIQTWGIESQIDLEMDFLQQITRHEYSLQNNDVDNDETMISEMVALQNQMATTLHPLHWMLPKGYQILSSMATSLARKYLHDGHHSLASPNVRNMLYLSTIALLHRARWIQRMGTIVYHDVSLEQAVNEVESAHHDGMIIIIPEQPSLQDIQNLLNENLPATPNMDVIDMAPPLFQAGQNLLLTGQTLQAVHIYKIWQPLFQRWNRLGEENLQRLKVLVQSQGTNNMFPNHLQ